MSGTARRDNRTAPPARSTDVTRDELEQAVREAFGQQVAEPRPPAADHAGVAVRRARRAQRRRTVAGLALAAVTTVAVSTGMMQLLADPAVVPGPAVIGLGETEPSRQPAPTPALPHPGPAGVELIVKDVLVTAAARRVTLTGVGAIEWAQRYPEASAWLLVGAETPAGRSLWIARPNGVTQVLLAGAKEIVLSRDGRHVAWSEGSVLVKGTVINNQVMVVARHPAPEGAKPVGLVGDDVLLRLHPDRGGYGLWDPVTGRTATEGGAGVRHVHGVRPDGLLVGQILAGTPRRPCLALLDPAEALTVVRSACGHALSGDGRGSVSPDGRWLLVNGDGGALLVDLDGLGPDGMVRAAGPSLTGPVSWSQSVAVHVLEGNRLARIVPDRVRAGQPVGNLLISSVPPGATVLPVAGTGF
ncbi:hypothetical protein [Micromonospora sp. NPDC126480]|uniref:hypothetical protein n=1 Tax=Micromonospora sp. NPDC126480 TaxID=3155312 RepID=UPI003323D91C